MSRTVIAAVVAVVIAALTAIAFFVTSTSFDDKVRKDADAQVWRAYHVVGKITQLEAIDVANKAERLAADHAFVSALKTESKTERDNQARLGFTKFTANEKEDDLKPDMIVLGNRVIISDMWSFQDRVMKIGVAPVIDQDAPVPANDPDGVVIIGAVVVAYAQTAQQAQHDKQLLGADIAYYDGTRVVATSFTKGGTEEDTGKSKQLTDIVKSGKVTTANGQQKVVID